MRKLTNIEIKQIFLMHRERYYDSDYMIGAGIYHAVVPEEKALRKIVEEIIQQDYDYGVEDIVKLTEEEVKDAITKILKVIKLGEYDTLEDMVMGYLLESHGPLFYGDLELITKICEEHEH